MAERKVKFDLGLTRFVAGVLIFTAHCVTAWVATSGGAPSTSAISQFMQIYLGLPSLVILCLMTGVVGAVTPIPQTSDHEGFAKYLNATVGVWFRLTVVFGGFILPIVGTALLHLTAGEPIVLERNPISMLLGMGPFWYLPALMYWSILRIWVRTPAQMKVCSAVLLFSILSFWMLPESGALLTVVGVRLNRLLIGIWFMTVGFLQGPGFFGRIMRQPPKALIVYSLLMACGIAAYEGLSSLLFTDERTICYYLQPAAQILNPAATNKWDIPVATRLLLMLQMALLWGVVGGLSLILLYTTARLGSLISPKSNVLLGETSFTIYVFHVPTLTIPFGWYFAGVSDVWIIPTALLYAVVCSFLLCLVTLLIRRSVWMRFWFWYKI